MATEKASKKKTPEKAKAEPQATAPKKVKAVKKAKPKAKKAPKKPERVTSELLHDVMKVAAAKVKSYRPEVRREGEQEMADISKRFKEQGFVPNPAWKK